MNIRGDYSPIEDYGVIGDSHAAALVSSYGSIDWLCLPSFDAPSIFARLLDAKQGGEWSIQPSARFHSRHRYLERTNVLETVFTGERGRARLLDFMPLSSEDLGAAASPPHMVVRLVEGVDGEIEIESSCRPRPDYARMLPTFSGRGRQVDFGPCTLTGPVGWTVDGANGMASSRMAIRAGERVAFVLSYNEEGAHSYDSPRDPSDLLETTIRFWRRWADRTTYEGPYRDAVVRSALALRLLVYTPTGAIVAAPTTSLPEEIGGERNWDYRFTWIRDASFTLYALLLAGHTEEDDAFFDWIVRRVQLRDTGIRILYPVTPRSQVTEETLDHLEGYRGSRPVRIGNAAADQVQLDVYGEVLDALYFACKAGRYDPSGVWDHFRQLVDWVAGHWHLQGSGIWEVRGGLRNFVYSKAMMWVALDRGVKLAKGNGLPGDIERWCRERDCLRDQVLAEGWSEKLGAFKQSYEDERLDAANLLLPVVGFIDGDDPKMLSTLDATLDRLVVDGLCYRYLDAPEGVPGSESTFVLCTFWLVNALMLAGRHEQAREIFEGVLRRASPLGLFAEEIDHTTGHHLGNFPQAFSHLGVINAAVSLAQAGKAGTVLAERSEAASRAGVGGGGQETKSHSAHKEEGE